MAFKQAITFQEIITWLSVIFQIPLPMMVVLNEVLFFEQGWMKQMNKGPFFRNTNKYEILNSEVFYIKINMILAHPISTF